MSTGNICFVSPDSVKAVNVAFPNHLLKYFLKKQEELVLTKGGNPSINLVLEQSRDMF